MKPVFLWSMKQRRISLVVWQVSLLAFILLNMVFYPTFKDQAAELQRSFETLPDAAVQLFGGSTDFFSPVGFLNSQIYFIVLPLLLGLFTISLGSSVLAQDEQDRSMEALLARPLSRSSLLSGKYLVVIAASLLASTVALVSVAISAAAVNLTIGIKPLVIVTIMCWLLALSLGSIAFVLTAAGQARGTAAGVAAAYGIGGYVIDSLSATIEWLRIPSKVFAFHYYQSEQLLLGVLDVADAAMLVLIVGVCVFVAWSAFRRRDIG